MKRFRFIVIIFVLGLFPILGSCIKDNDSNPDYHRVVILYLAANNNLSSYAASNIVNLKEGYLPEEESKDIVLVYSHLSGSYPKLLRLYKNNSGIVQEDVVVNYGNQNSATPAVLESLLNRAKIIFPAQEYGLILWSHASGWLPEGYYGNPEGFNAFMPDPYAGIVKSFAEDSGAEMKITELNDAIPFHLSFIIFDCCFMGGIETVYELKDKCDYIVASPTEILATGFPYDQIMKPLFENKADLTEACQLYYDYYNNMSGVYRSATISIYQTDKLQKVAEASRMVFNNNRSKIATLNMGSIQHYYRLDKHWFYDLADFMESIATPSEYADFKTALDNAVIAKWTTEYFIDLKIDNYSGVSTYIQNPANTYLDNFYKDYKWNIYCEMIK
ncbi:MAG: clostripain-related cysteine peptidase [Rikenellaceae bacterium]